MPFISVVLPAYNRERLIGRAIESVLAQDFRDCEVVVTDDASRDGTAAVVSEYAARDPRVRLGAMESILRRHGAALREHGPSFHLSMLRGAMKFFFLAGDRRAGLRWAAQVLRREPLSLRSWSILLFGLVHPVLLARIDSATMSMRLPALPGRRR